MRYLSFWFWCGQDRFLKPKKVKLARATLVQGLKKCFKNHKERAKYVCQVTKCQSLEAFQAQMTQINQVVDRQGREICTQTIRTLFRNFLFDALPHGNW